jgi:hypothetical protein
MTCLLEWALSVSQTALEGVSPGSMARIVRYHPGTDLFACRASVPAVVRRYIRSVAVFISILPHARCRLSILGG